MPNKKKKLFAATCTKGDTVLFFDYRLIEAAIRSGQKVIEKKDVFITQHPVIRARGIKSYKNPMPNVKAVRVAGHSELVTLYPEFNSDGTVKRINEILPVSAGNANHDISRPGDITQGEQVLSVGSGFKMSMRPKSRTDRDVERVKSVNTKNPIPKDKDGRIIVPYDRQKCFINTQHSPRRFTTLSRRPRPQDIPEGEEPPKNRNNDHDGVYMNGKSIPYPIEGKNWRAPHHIYRYKRRWWVANSGAGEIVDITNGKVYVVGGFPRGLIRGPQGTLLFSRSVHRGFPEQEWASIGCAILTEPEGGEESLVVLSHLILTGYRDAYQGAVL